MNTTPTQKGKYIIMAEKEVVLTHIEEALNGAHCDKDLKIEIVDTLEIPECAPGGMIKTNALIVMLPGKETLEISGGNYFLHWNLILLRNDKRLPILDKVVIEKDLNDNVMKGIAKLIVETDKMAYGS